MSLTCLSTGPAFPQGATPSSGVQDAEAPTPLPFSPDPASFQDPANIRQGHPALPPMVIALRGMLREGRYDDLQARFDGLLQAQRADIREEFALYWALGAFERTDPEITQALDAWLAARPGAWAPLAARATHRAQLAWDARGGRLGSETSDAQFASMRAHFADARADADAALGIEADILPLYDLLIRAAMALGEDATAEAVYRRGVALAPGSALIPLAMVINLTPRWGGSEQEMARLATQCEQRTGANPALALVRGALYDERAWVLWMDDKDAAAVSQATEALSYGDYAPFYLRRAYALFALKAYEASAGDYGRAATLTPDSLDAQVGLARTFYYLGRYDEAQGALDIALALSPTHYEALRYRERCITLPIEAKAVLETARDLRDAGRHDKALVAVQEAARQAPDSAEVEHVWGSILKGQGRRSEARPHFERSVALSPWRHGGWGQIAHIFDHEKDYPACVANFDRAVALSPEDPWYRYARAWCIEGVDRHDPRVKQEYGIACTWGHEASCERLERMDGDDDLLAGGVLLGCVGLGAGAFLRMRRRRKEGEGEV